MIEYNDIAAANYNDNVLVSCLHCGRTFIPEKLIKHNFLCTSSNPMKRLIERESSPNKVTDDQTEITQLDESKSVVKEIIERPLFLACYACGMGFGTRSLEIHIITCRKKW